MALVTAVLQRIYGENGTEARVEIDFDDGPDGEGEALIAVRCVNGLTRPVTVVIQRGNGSSWFNVVVEPGQTRSQNAGGPVREVSDLPVFHLRA